MNLLSCCIAGTFIKINDKHGFWSPKIKHVLLGKNHQVGETLCTFDAPKQTHNWWWIALRIHVGFTWECEASETPDMHLELVKWAGSTLSVRLSICLSGFYTLLLSVVRKSLHFSMIRSANFKSVQFDSFIITPCSWLNLQKCPWEHLHPLTSGRSPPRS